MRWLAVTVLLLIFGGVIIARWPASFVARRLPAPFVCQASGTVWNGSCEPVRRGAQELGTVRWQLRPAPLLGGRIDALVTMRAAGLTFDGHVARSSSGSLRLSDAQAQGDLASLTQLLRNAGLGSATTVNGRFQAQLPSVVLDGAGRVQSLDGEIQLDSLSQSAAPRELGSWTVRFDSAASRAGEPLGRVQDRGGPFQFSGTLRLTDGRGYLLQGNLRPRGIGNPEIENALRLFGPADATGQRNVTIEGRF